MSILSADTLFHYTRRKEWLINILKNGIAPRFSKELDQSLGDSLTMSQYLYVPMACFCDTPLSLVNKHMDIYGSYGVGLTKEWGIKNQLNPVIYMIKENSVNSNLVISNHYAAISTHFSTHKGSSNAAEFSDSSFIYQFLKPYKSGSYYKRGNRIYKNYVYYDEREWRYVPVNVQHNRLHPNVIPSPTRLQIKEANDSLRSSALTFNAKDINYIIVKKAGDVDDILRAIEKSKFFDIGDKQYLTTTLITADRIKKDF